MRWRHPDDTGASAVEYGLILVAIAAVLVAIAFGLGGLIDAMFADSCSRIDANASTPASC